MQSEKNTIKNPKSNHKQDTFRLQIIMQVYEKMADKILEMTIIFGFARSLRLFYWHKE